jgi:hypothetical protein
MRVCLGLAMAAVLGFAGLLRAAPLDLKQVGADAKWAVHVDFDAARASTVLKNVYPLIAKQHPQIEEGLAKLRQEWQFDPGADLHGVTFYGQRFKQGEGVAIVHAKMNEQLLLEKAKQAPGHQVSNHGKYELHTWSQAEGSKRQRNMTGSFFKPDVLIFGGSEAEVAAALDVLDGTKQNFADKEPSLAGEIPAGTVLFAGARDLSEIKLPPNSPAESVLKQSDSLVLSIGEHEGKAFLAGSLNVKKADVAEGLKAIVEGFRAAAAIQHGNDPEAMKILDALKVADDDKKFTVEWSVPADALWAHLQKHWGEMSRNIRHHAEKSGNHPSGEK